MALPTSAPHLLSLRGWYVCICYYVCSLQVLLPPLSFGHDFVSRPVTGDRLYMKANLRYTSNSSYTGWSRAYSVSTLRYTVTSPFAAMLALYGDLGALYVHGSRWIRHIRGRICRVRHQPKARHDSGVISLSFIILILIDLTPYLLHMLL